MTFSMWWAIGGSGSTVCEIRTIDAIFAKISFPVGRVVEVTHLIATDPIRGVKLGSAISRNLFGIPQHSPAL